MGGSFTKHHPPHHRREICATCLYMENFLLKIDQKIVQEWEKFVLTPIHTVAIIPNCTFLQGCADAIHTYGHTNTTTVT